MVNINLFSALSRHFVFICVVFRNRVSVDAHQLSFFMRDLINSHHIARARAHTRTQTLALISQIWDLSMGKCIATLQTSDQPVTCVDFHPSEFICAVGGGMHTRAR